MTALLLITDSPAVLELVPFLEVPVVRCPTVGAARRLLADPARPSIGLVAWGPDVLTAAEDHWRLNPLTLRGAPQVALRLTPNPSIPFLSGMWALGVNRSIVLPLGLSLLNIIPTQQRTGRP